MAGDEICGWLIVLIDDAVVLVIFIAMVVVKCMFANVSDVVTKYKYICQQVYVHVVLSMYGFCPRFLSQVIDVGKAEV